MIVTVKEFVLARLDEETILVKWAKAVRGSVEAGLTDERLGALATTWEEHPDYRGEWDPGHKCNRRAVRSQ